MLRSRSWAGGRLTWATFNQIKERTPLLRSKLRLRYPELQALVEAKADHQRAEDDRPARTDPIGDSGHDDPAGAGAEPRQRTGERWNGARPVHLVGNVLERYHADAGAAERHPKDEERY
jgi:hypothetical protein